MSTYRLPLVLARRRLGQGLDVDPGEKQDVNGISLEEEARAVALGRGVAAQAIVHALGRDPAERSIGLHHWLHHETKTEAIGWILCEAVFDRATGRPSTNEVNGLLLASNSGVYAYSANVNRNPDLAAQMGHKMTAWGRMLLAPPVDSTAGVLACKSIAEVPLGDDLIYIDRQIGAIAGSLTLEDLFAGLIVRKQRLRDFPAEIPLPGTTANSAIVPAFEAGPIS
jgi:hypothetical protein